LHLPCEIGLLALVAIMRFSHFLLGLAGLAGLAAAAPTPDAGSVQVVDGVDASPVAAADTVLDEYLAMV
jgi:hypothetical protein